MQGFSPHGFSGCRAQTRVVGSVVAAQGLQSTGLIIVAYRLSCSEIMWNLPRPGIKSVSLALQGGFLTTGPPDNPLLLLLTFLVHIFIFYFYLFIYFFSSYF